MASANVTITQRPRALSRAGLVPTLMVLLCLPFMWLALRGSARVASPPGGPPALGASAPRPDADYRFFRSPGGAGFAGYNPAQGLSLRSAARGIELSSLTGRHLRLGLASVSVDGRRLPLSGATASVEGGRLRYDAGTVEEWFADERRGVEQGFSFDGPIHARGCSCVELSLSLSGAERVSRSADGGGVILDGAQAFRYGDLSATDAGGRTLPSSLGLRGNRMVIRVRTAGARAPITIDPLLEPYATLSPPSTAGSGLSDSSSISADGNTALVAEGRGAWIFVRRGSSWVAQTRLPLEEAATGGGVLVALSGDGNTAVLAGPSAAGPVAAWVFSRQGGSWSTRGIPLVASGTGPRPPSSPEELLRFASSVAVSADGEAVLVGAAWDAGYAGAAWVFVRSAEGWTQYGPKLTAANPAEEERFGGSVALSGAGDVALIGATGDRRRPPNGSPPEGTAYAFSRSAGVWTQTAQLADNEHPNGDYGWGFGSTVALSADASTALIGAHGRAIIYYRRSSGWSQHVPALKGYPYEDNATYGSANSFGSDVALAAAGTRALVTESAFDDCGRYMNEWCSGSETLWSFERRGEAWVREPLPVVDGGLADAVPALSGEGHTALFSRKSAAGASAASVLVSEITPLPEAGFEIEPTPRVGYEGQVQMQVWSAVPARFTAIARALGRTYGLARSYGLGDLSLTITPGRFFNRYFRRHKHLLLTVSLAQRPGGHGAPVRRTIRLPVRYEEFTSGL